MLVNHHIRAGYGGTKFVPTAFENPLICTSLIFFVHITAFSSYEDVSSMPSACLPLVLIDCSACVCW